MKRILLILTVILTSASAVWAESNVTFSNLNEVLVEDNSLFFCKPMGCMEAMLV